jgi:death-on-curing protein
MIKWLYPKLVMAIHDEQLRAHGGASGVRDIGLMESALARPENAAAYGEPDVAELGALYALGIARNHPFIDGNKRTAWTAMVLFFEQNAMLFEPPDAEATVVMLDMAAGTMADHVFIGWVRSHAKPRPEVAGA